MSALVIEDDAATGAALCKLLRSNGWKTEWACDLLNAEMKVRAFDPDLLLADVHLTHGDTPEWLRTWVGEGRRIVFLTALCPEDTEQLKNEFPGCDVIHKPAEPEDIIRVLGRGRRGDKP